MKRGFIIDDIVQLKAKLKKIPRVAGVMAVQHFKGNIDKQKGADGYFKKRSFETKRTSGKKILKDRHTLYDSIKILSITDRAIVVGINGNEVPYAEAHNEGAKIEISDKMRKYFWRQYYKLGGKEKAKAKKEEGASTEEWEIWRNLALKQTDIVIPRRRFIYNSVRLERDITRAIKMTLEKGLNSV